MAKSNARARAAPKKTAKKAARKTAARPEGGYQPTEPAPENPTPPQDARSAVAGNGASETVVAIQKAAQDPEVLQGRLNIAIQTIHRLGQAMDAFSEAFKEMEYQRRKFIEAHDVAVRQLVESRQKAPAVTEA